MNSQEHQSPAIDSGSSIAGIGSHQKAFISSSLQQPINGDIDFDNNESERLNRVPSAPNIDLPNNRYHRKFQHRPLGATSTVRRRSTDGQIVTSE